MDLLYCSIPSRMANRNEEIMDFVQKRGLAPFAPFLAFPVERFEGGPVGREKTMEFCRRTIHLCDRFGLFGFSEGTILMELSYNLDVAHKPVDHFFREFDPQWSEYIRRMAEKIDPSSQPRLYLYLKRILKEKAV